MLLIRTEEQFRELVKPGQELWQLDRKYCETPRGIKGPVIFRSMKDVENPNGPRVEIEDPNDPLHTFTFLNQFVGRGEGHPLGSGTLLTEADAREYLQEQQRAYREDPAALDLLEREQNDAAEFEKEESGLAAAI